MLYKYKYFYCNSFLPTDPTILTHLYTTVGEESLCRAESLCRNTCISYFRHLELRQEANFFTAYHLCGLE